MQKNAEIGLFTKPSVLSLDEIPQHSDWSTGDKAKATSPGWAVGPLLLLTGIFFLNFTARIVLAPLMPTIERELGIAHAEAGSLFLLISFGYFLSLTGAGVLSSRITHRGTVILSAMTVGLALLGISLSTSLRGIRIGLFMLGIAAGIYLPSGIATVTSLISPRHWGKGIAIHELAPNLSFVAAPLICEALLKGFGWRGILALLGGASILAALVFIRLGGKAGKFPGQAPSLASFRAFLTQPDFWIMTILFSLGIGASLGVYTMLPLYLVAERGIERHWANTLVALSRISGLGMAFLAGWTADRFGPRHTMGAVLLLTGMMTVLLGAPWRFCIMAAVFLQPMLAVSFFPPGFAALTRIGPATARNVVVSLTVPMAFLFGGGTIPALIGLMGDLGSFALGIVVVGSLILSGFALSFYLRLPDNSEERA